MGFQLNPFGIFNGNGSITPNAPNAGTNSYGQAYAQNQGTAGVGGTDSANQQQTIGMMGQNVNALGQMAAGRGPDPALAALNQQTMANQQFAQAQAGGARGNMGMAGAMHGAMQTGANLNQTAAGQGAQAIQQQQFGAINAQTNALSGMMSAQAQQRANDLQAMGMNSSDAIAQAQIEEQQTANNQKASTGMLGSALNGIGGMIQQGEGSLLPQNGAG